MTRTSGRSALIVLAPTATLVVAAIACGGRTPLPAPEELAPLAEDVDLQRCVSAVPLNATGAATLEIVLDGSGSMESDGKWVSATSALSAIFDDLAAKNDPMLAVGLLVFEDDDDITRGDGPYPTAVDVPPKRVDEEQRERLQGRLQTNPSGGTPTLRALEGAYRMLENFRSTPDGGRGGQRVVVLLSDGVPNGGKPEQSRCVALARANNSGSDPIRTFAVGIGPFPGSAFSYDAEFMGQLAVAGGTASSPSCLPHATSVRQACHFQITPGGGPPAEVTKDFVQAMNEIRGKLAPACEFDLVGDVGDANLDATTVVWLDGDRTARTVPRSDTEGWTFDDPAKPTHVTIHGALCRRILADAAGYVEVRFACEAPR